MATEASVEVTFQIDVKKVGKNHFHDAKVRFYNLKSAKRGAIRLKRELMERVTERMNQSGMELASKQFRAENE
jgi:hypothetical protein